MQASLPTSSAPHSKMNATGPPVAATLAVALGCALLAGTLYAKTRQFHFVWDDWYLTLLPIYDSIDLWRYFSSVANGYQYLPLRDLSFAIDTALHGKNAGGFHLTNTLGFAADIALLCVFYARLLTIRTEEATSKRALPLSALCACLFAAHPLQAESVAFVSSRNAVLALGFSLGAMLAYLHFARTQSRAAWVLSLAGTFAALLSKQTSVALPLVLLLLHWYAAPRDRWAAALRSVAPHLLLCCVGVVGHALIARQAGLVGAENAFSPLSLLQRLPLVAFVPQFYVWKFFAPVNLTVEYRTILYTDASWLLLLSSLVLGGIAALLLQRGLAERRLGALLLLAYFAALVPVLNLVPTNPVIADRYAQPALVFLVPLAVLPIFARLPRVPAVALGLALIAALSYTSGRQIETWRDGDRLFTHALKVDPEATESLANHAAILWTRGRRSEALERLHALSQQRPNDLRYPLHRGWAALDAGEYGEAERQLLRASSLAGPQLHLAHIKLAELYEQLGDSERALAAYEAAQHAMGQEIIAYGSQRESVDQAIERLRLELR